MTDSFAPPWAGPHNDATPAATHANGLAPEEPAIFTVDVAKRKKQKQMFPGEIK